MTHDELRELSGGYVLGILDEPERRRVSSTDGCSSRVASTWSRTPKRRNAWELELSSSP